MVEAVDLREGGENGENVHFEGGGYIRTPFTDMVQIVLWWTIRLEATSNRS